ncbi:MAG: hypothetical protein DDT33_00663 [Firmicutes bacterium]|nr:hypothetical protein [Bacillota bacterium]
MNPKTMIALVGEQPIPILLPILHEKKSSLIGQVILVCSTRTKPVGERLKTVLQTTLFTGNNMVELLCVEPYDILKAKNELTKFILERKFDRTQIIFNLTGGTKSMSFAAYYLAAQWRSPFLYLQSEGRKSLLHFYNFAEGGKLTYNSKEIPPLLDIDIYLNAHLDGYKEKPPKPDHPFEIVVLDALRSKLDEIKTSITFEGIGAGEIDLVLRCGNNVGIAEVKRGTSARGKEGIDQLNTAAASRFLGTYTSKILIVDREYPSDNLKLAKAHRIKVIELPSFVSNNGNLSNEEIEKLITIVIESIGG